MIRAEGAGYTYPSGGGVGPVDLAVGAGERVLLAGPSGSGKSTLLRRLAGLMGQGLGVSSGRVIVGGVDVDGSPARVRAAHVGFVGQDPGDQLLCGRVDDELAFGPEALGWDPEATRQAVREGLRQVGLAARRDPRTGSAGERQRVVTAAVRASGARVLLLDEPLAHLDPRAAARLLSALADLSEAGVTVVVAEHRLDACWTWAGRVVVLGQGRVAFDGARDEVTAGDLVGLQLPAALAPPPPLPARVAPLGLQWEGALPGGKLQVFRGERLAVVGANGAGKTTLLGRLPGLLVPEDPDLSLFSETVAEELAVARERDPAAPVQRWSERMGLDGLAGRAPQGLSRGQRLRVAVAAAACVRPPLLLLDEPTSGQDAEAVDALFDALEAEAQTVVFATHDLELAARRAHRVLWLAPTGWVVGPPNEVLPQVDLPATPRWEALGITGGDAGEAGADEETVDEPAGADPRFALLLLGAAGVWALLLDRWYGLAALAALSALVALWALPRAWWGRAFGLALVVVWGTVTSQALFYADEPRVAWVQLGGLSVWREGVRHGFQQSLRLVSMGLLGVSVAVQLGPDRLLRGLVGLGLPWTVALLAATSLRWLPAVWSEWTTVRRARGRGRPPRRPWARLRDELLLLRPVIARAVRRARHLAEALEARGYGADAAVRPRHASTLGWARGALLGGVGVATTGLVAAKVAWFLYLHGIASAPALVPVYAWVRAWA